MLNTTGKKIHPSALFPFCRFFISLLRPLCAIPRLLLSVILWLFSAYLSLVVCMIWARFLGPFLAFSIPTPSSVVPLHSSFTHQSALYAAHRELPHDVRHCNRVEFGDNLTERMRKERDGGWTKYARERKATINSSNINIYM